MPSHVRQGEDQNERQGNSRRRGHPRRSLDVTLLEGMSEDIGKTLHTKYGQVLPYLYFFVNC